MSEKTVNSMFEQLQKAVKGELNTSAIGKGRKDVETAKFCNDPFAVAELLANKYNAIIDVVTEGKGIGMPCNPKILKEIVAKKGYGIEDISRAILFTQCTDKMRVEAGFKSSRDKSARGVYNDLARGINHAGSGKKLGLVCARNEANGLHLPVAIGLTCKQIASIPESLFKDFVKLAAFCKGLKEEVVLPSPSTDKAKSKEKATPKGKTPKKA